MADLGQQLRDYLARHQAPGPPAAGPQQQQQQQKEEAAAAAGGAGGWPGWGWPWAAETEPCLPGLSRWQRLAAAGLCALLAALCFGLAALYAPLLLLRARKFALLWSLGSLCALAAAALLRGPALLRRPGRGPALYAAALCGTLYAALGLRSAPLTALGAAAQLGAAAAALLDALPGGAAGLRRLAGIGGAALRRRVLPL
ncbi:vesicle transport protein SFT2C [Mergus octosetaceus]